MKKKFTVFAFFLFVALWLIASPSLAEVQVNGVVKSFNAQSGRLVFKTQSGAETAVTISQTVKVYIKTKNEDVEVADVDKPQFLKHNLFKGTRITIEKIEGVVTTLWIVEVPA